MHLITGLVLGEMLLGSKILGKSRAAGAPFELVHVLPGRIRVKIHALVDNTALGDQIRTGLGGIDGVTEVKIDTRTGSVLILFNDTPEVRKALVALIEQLSKPPEGLASKPPGVPMLRQRVQELGDQANAQVMAQSHGAADLITLLGLVAAGFGTKSMIAPGIISRWQGMTLLYWGYNILRR